MFLGQDTLLSYCLSLPRCINRFLANDMLGNNRATSHPGGVGVGGGGVAATSSCFILKYRDKLQHLLAECRTCVHCRCPYFNLMFYVNNFSCVKEVNCFIHRFVTVLSTVWWKFTDMLVKK